MQDSSRAIGNNQKLIVIIGGGFAGTTLLKCLAKRVPDDHEVVLISEESYTTFYPMLPEVVGASIFPEQVLAPIRTMFEPSAKVRLIMGSVSSINPDQKTLICSSLSNERKIHYEHLVLAFGNRAKLDLIPGMAEHSMPLKTIGDAMHIRNIVLRRIAQMELENDPDTLKSLGHFVVIGGGFSGVEVAGELIDCLHSVAHYYPLAKSEDLKVTVLHNQDRLLLELPEKLGNAAYQSLSKRGVDIRLGSGAGATEITAKSVALADGTLLQSSTVICTIGTQPNKLIEQLKLPVARGRVMASSSFAIPGVDGIWALGDCAHVVNLYDNNPCPPTAQFAVRQAKLLADNLLSKINGKALKEFNYKSLGSMAAIGHQKGVASVLGISISGIFAWLLWRAYYLFLMPTWGRKIRIYVEWTWGMFFPPDITHLRFTRSQDTDIK
jgi:NADH dehydrogenase